MKLSRFSRSRQTAEAILDALNKKQFELHYQPIVDAQTHQVQAVEALLRWSARTEDEFPFPTPASLIDIAEITGVISPLGDWIIEQALTDSHRWPQIATSINISPIQIADPEFNDRFERLIERTEANPLRIIAEITESTLLQSSSQIDSTLRNLNAIGVQIALDDFGSGHASLPTLQAHSFDKLKIDASYIRNGAIDLPVNRKLVAGMISIAHSLDMAVVGEGVETILEAEILSFLGCDQHQGFLYSRPCPPDGLPEILDRLSTPVAITRAAA